MITTPLRMLQAATFISWLGDTMSNLAIPWFVYQLTGSPVQTGLSIVVRSIGTYLASTLSGPYIDRFPGKPLVVCCNLIAGCCLLAIPLLWMTESLQLWHLYLLTMLAALIERPGYLALVKSVPEVAAASEVSVERASGLNEVLYHSSVLAGPPVAGFLIAIVGSSWVLAIDATTFLLAAMIVGIGIPGRLLHHGEPEESWSYRERLAEGLRFLRNDRLLVALIACMALGILLINAPLLSILLQLYAREVLDSSVQLGLLSASFAVGALLGAMLFSWQGGHLEGRLAWIVGYGIMPFPYVAIALQAPTAVIAFTLALMGLGIGVVTPMYASIRFKRVPVQLRGRVFSALSPVTGLAAPLGVLLPSLLLGSLGLRGVAILLSLLVVLFWSWMVTAPVFHSIPSNHRS